MSPLNAGALHRSWSVKIALSTVARVSRSSRYSLERTGRRFVRTTSTRVLTLSAADFRGLGEATLGRRARPLPKISGPRKGTPFEGGKTPSWDAARQQLLDANLGTSSSLKSLRPNNFDVLVS